MKKFVILLVLFAISAVIFSCSFDYDEIPNAPSHIWVSAVNYSIGSSDYSDVSISWNSSKNAKYYKVYRAESSDGEFVYIGRPRYNHTTNYKEKDLPPAKYYYRVSAVNDNGESELSKSASATVK